MSPLWTRSLLTGLALVATSAQKCDELRHIYESASASTGHSCCEDASASLNSVHPIQRAQGLTIPPSPPPPHPASRRDAQVDMAYDQYLARAPTEAERQAGRAHLERRGYNHFVHTLVQEERVLGRFGFDGLPDDLSGNSYFITGMSSGIGFQLAVQLAKRGGRVFGYARTRAVFDVHKASAMATEESQRYPLYFGEVNVSSDVFERITFEEVDMRVKAQVDDYFERHGATDFAHLAGAFLNAGISLNNPNGAYRSMEDDLRDCPTRAQTTATCSSYNTELHGDAFNLLHLPGLLRQSRAPHRALVLTASITGVDPSFPFDYGVVKHAKVFDTFPRMKAQLEPLGISVHVVLPDFVLTDLILANFAFQSATVVTYREDGVAELSLTPAQTASGKFALGVESFTPTALRDAAYDLQRFLRSTVVRDEFDWRLTHPTLTAYALASSAHTSTATASAVLFHNSVLVPQFTPLFAVIDAGQGLDFKGLLDKASWTALQHWSHRETLLQITKDTVLRSITGATHALGATLWRVV